MKFASSIQREHHFQSFFDTWNKKKCYCDARNCLLRLMHFS